MVEQPQVLAQMLAFESTRVPLFWPLLALGAVLIAFGLIKRRTFVAAGGAVLGALALVAGTGFTVAAPVVYLAGRSEEHTSELQSLMRLSYAVFCLKKIKTLYTEKVSRTLHPIAKHEDLQLNDVRPILLT